MDKAEPPTPKLVLCMTPTNTSRAGSGERGRRKAKDRQGLMEPSEPVSMGTDRLKKVAIPEAFWRMALATFTF